MIAHVQFHEFLLAVERAAHPELEGAPLIIGSTRTGRGFVALASAQARERGVRTGMRIDQAIALAPAAHCLPGSIERYLETSAQVDECLRGHVRRIEWPSLDEAWLEIPSGDRARANTRGALEGIREEIARRFGMQAAIGVGSTKAVAAVASRLVTPSGMLIVLPGYEARLLAPLDVARLPGVSDEALAALRTRRITTLGELASLEDADLFALIGRGGGVLARHAMGIDDRPLLAAETPKGIARGRMFAACAGPQARAAIAELAANAAAALRRSQHATRQLRLRVRDQAGERMRTQKLDSPLSGDAEIGDAIDALARRLLHPGRDLFEAAVFLTSLVPLEPQLALFSTSTGRRSA